jgi:DNA-binding NarL/FixJ family response regulator
VAATPTARIIVVDDDDNLRTLLVELLARRGYDVLATDTGEDAVDTMRRCGADLVIVDVHLPGMSGYEVCRELRAEFGDRLAIVFISGVRTEPYDRVVGLRLGADDYIVKPFAPDELLARVDRLIEHALPLDPEATQGLAFGLTPRELEVLRLLAGGTSSRVIAEELSVSNKTVASHIQSILVKLDVHTQAQAVSVAFVSGLIEVRRS